MEGTADSNKIEPVSSTNSNKQTGFFKVVDVEMLVSWKFGKADKCELCKTKLTEKATM